jgi:hypothetical protein
MAFAASTPRTGFKASAGGAFVDRFRPDKLIYSGALSCKLHNMVTAIAAIYSGGSECRGQLQIGEVLHLDPANCTFEGRSLWNAVLGHSFTPGASMHP